MKHMAAVVAGLGGACAGALAQNAPQWSGFEPNVFATVFAMWDEDGPAPGRPVLLMDDMNLPRVGQTDGQGRIAAYDARSFQSLGLPFREQWGTRMFFGIEVATSSGIGSPRPGLFVGGIFKRAGGAPVNGLAHWDGTQWSDFTNGLSARIAYSMKTFDEDGEGPDEPNIFIGAGFAQVGGVPLPGLVRWDGTNFSVVGGGIAGRFFNTNPIVNAMIEFDDDGPGPRKPALYVGGDFDWADGKRANGIARWDGTNWETLGVGTGSDVRALAVFDADGAGPEPAMLYAGGGFTHDPGGARISYLVRWDGQRWSGVPGFALAGGIYSLEVHDDDGDGPNKPALFVSGLFSSINGMPAYGVVKWDGSQWFPLGSGFTGFAGSRATDMQRFDEDGDPATPAGLYAAGGFEWAGGILTPTLARWGMPNPICFADCDESTGLGVLDIFDFLCFQNSFVTGDPYACDCDTATGTGVCDIFDFLCFQNAFVAGCP